MSLKGFNRFGSSFYRVMTSSLWLLWVFTLIVFFIVLYTIEQRFDPVAYVQKHAIKLNSNELLHTYGLDGKLVAVTGRVYSYGAAQEPVHFPTEQFVVLKHQEQRFERGHKRRKKWRFQKYHLIFSKEASLDGHDFCLSDIIDFFNLSSVIEKFPVFISQDGNSSYQSPELGDSAFIFTGCIRSSSQATILGTLQENRFVPFETAVLDVQTYQKKTLFYLSRGTFTDLLKGLTQAQEKSVENERLGFWICLCIILIIPYWLLFKWLWPVHNYALKEHYDSYGNRTDSDSLDVFDVRILIFIGTLAVVGWGVLQMALYLFAYFA